MGEITICSVMAVMKKAVEANDGFSTVVRGNSKKTHEIKYDLIKRGFALALKEMDKHPLLKNQYDRQSLKAACSSSGDTMHESDARMKFSEMLFFLFANLSKAIEREEARSERKDISELSLAQHTTVRQALSHLPNLVILPLLPKGLITPVDVDEWWTSEKWQQVLMDKHYRIVKLRTYLKTILDLCEVSFQVKQTVVSTYMLGVVFAGETLHHYGHNVLHGQYRSFLSSVDAAEVFIDIMMLMRRTPSIREEWHWLSISVITLLNEMIGEGHLNDLFRMFAKKGLLVGSVTGVPFLHDVANALCSGYVKSMPPLQFFESLIDQFISWIDSGEDDKAKLGLVMFSLFIDAMAVRQPYFAKILIFDRYLLPLERLLDNEDEEVGRSFSSALRNLAKILENQNSKVLSKSLCSSPRLRKLLFLFSSIFIALEEFGVDENIDEDSDDARQLIRFQADLLSCSKSVLEFLPKKELYILSVTRQTEILRQVEIKTNQKFVTPKIKVVGEENKPALQCRFYPRAFKAKFSSDYQSHSFSNTVRYFVDITKPCEKANFLYSCLLETFKAFIQDNGYFNRLTTSEEYNHEYVLSLTIMANALCTKLEEEVDNDPDLFTTNVTDKSTLSKLLNLTIITMTSAVNNIEKEVTKQKKEASLDIRVAKPKYGEELIVHMRSLVVSTATYGIKFTKFIPVLRMYEREKLKGLESEINEVRRLIAVLKKVLGEMEEVPEQYKGLVEELEKKDLISTIAEMEGSGKTNGENDSSFFKKNELVRLLKGVAYEKGQALLTIARLLMKRNTRLIEIYDETFHDLVLAQISNADSYVYLSAINCAAEAALAMTDKIIPFVNLFSEFSSVREKKNANGEVVKSVSIQEKVIVRLRIASVICKVFDNIGAAAPKYARETIDCVMKCVQDMDEDIRASAYAVIEHLFKTMAVRYTIHSDFNPILESINHTLMCEKSCQVRRNAISIVRAMLAGAGREMLTTLSDQLLPINRMLTSVLQNERDQVVRVHAQLAKEEIGESLKEKLVKEVTEGARQIKM